MQTLPADPSAWMAAAQQLGAQALPAFLGLLLSAVCGAGLCCALLQRRRAGRPESAEEAAAGLGRLVGGFAAGFALILGAAALFAAVAARLGPGRTMGLADQALTDAVRQHTPAAALQAFGVATHLGDPAVLTLLAAGVAALLWRRRRRLLAAGWLLALGGNALLNPLLKRVFERARPWHDPGPAQATGFSFPSGHSSGAMVAYGMLLYVALQLLPARWQPAAAMAAVAAVLTTACSRVFLQVHFASDVLAGLLSGLAWLGVCIASLELARQRRRRRQRRDVTQYSQKIR